MSPRRLPSRRRVRFQAPYPSREFLIVRWIQLILLALLFLASVYLASTSFQTVRAHFVEKYGVQAYFLPVVTLALALFLLIRFLILWRTFREERDSAEDEESDDQRS